MSLPVHMVKDLGPMEGTTQCVSCSRRPQLADSVLCGECRAGAQRMDNDPSIAMATDITTRLPCDSCDCELGCKFF